MLRNSAGKMGEHRVVEGPFVPALLSKTCRLLLGAALLSAGSLAYAKEPVPFPKEFSLLPHRDIAGVCSSSLTSLIKGLLARTGFSEKDRNTLAANASATCTLSAHFSFEDLGTATGEVVVQLGSNAPVSLPFTAEVSRDAGLAGHLFESFNSSTGLKANLLRGDLSTAAGYQGSRSAYGLGSASKCPQVSIAIPSNVNNPQLSFRYSAGINYKAVTTRSSGPSVERTVSSFAGDGYTETMNVTAGETVTVTMTCPSNGAAWLDNFLVTWQ